MTVLRLFSGLLLLNMIYGLRTCLSNPELSRIPEHDLILIPAGEFLMGENDSHKANQPQHRVYLDDYFIQRTEVTRSAYKAFLLESNYQALGWNISKRIQYNEQPITAIRWLDAQAYCDYYGMRLPTEAEWEKAARGTDHRKFPWGNEWQSSYANTLESDSQGPLPVGQYPHGASPYGVLNMCGNASEWVADGYSSSYYTVSPDVNPQGPLIKTDLGIRGGSWLTPADWSTTYFRNGSHYLRPPDVGFRCAKSED